MGQLGQLGLLILNFYKNENEKLQKFTKKYLDKTNV